jgi:hypothetical protein
MGIGYKNKTVYTFFDDVPNFYFSIDLSLRRTLVLFVLIQQIQQRDKYFMLNNSSQFL